MLETFILMYGNQIIGLILCAIAGAVGMTVKAIYKNHINDYVKQGVARSVVLCVEQVWKEIHGKDKLQKALDYAEIILRKKGIPFDADEMMVLIEAAVAEFNRVFAEAEPAAE